MSTPTPRSDAPLLTQLRAQLVAQLAALPRDLPAGLVSVTLRLPQVPRRLPQLATAAQFQCTHTHSGELRAGYGEVAAWQSRGHQRWAELAAVARAWTTTWHHADPDATGYRGFALLGFAAVEDDTATSDEDDALPNALLWVPQIALRVTGEVAAIICTAPAPLMPEQIITQWLALLTPLMAALYPAHTSAAPRLSQHQRGVMTLTTTRALPERGQWGALVNAALTHIHAGHVDKVVLSRQVSLTTARPLQLERLHAALSDLFPSCQVLTLRYHGSNFVAATPERLLQLRWPRVEVDAIAGTAARAKAAVQDALLTTALCQSEKNLREHQYVVTAIQAALTAAGCQAIDTPAPPQVLQLNNAQHLWTPITAEIAAAADVFTLAEQLHPTPATNGEPRTAAQAWLQANEPFARGWYTGAAGWVEPAADGHLNGDLWVLLRCARVRERHIQLFAGAGIIAGSDPQTEWDETEAKLSAMLTALQLAFGVAP